MASSRTSSTAPSSDVAFTDGVKAVQSRLGSRSSYARMEREGGFETEITGDVAAFVAEQRSFFLATASTSAWATSPRTPGSTSSSSTTPTSAV